MEKEQNKKENSTDVVLDNSSSYIPDKKKSTDLSAQKRRGSYLNNLMAESTTPVDGCYRFRFR